VTGRSERTQPSRVLNPTGSDRVRNALK
jgi:hypothetical protein